MVSQESPFLKLYLGRQAEEFEDSSLRMWERFSSCGHHLLKYKEMLHLKQKPYVKSQAGKQGCVCVSLPGSSEGLRKQGMVTWCESQVRATTMQMLFSGVTADGHLI